MLRNSLKIGQKSFSQSISQGISQAMAQRGNWLKLLRQKSLVSVSFLTLILLGMGAQALQWELPAQGVQELQLRARAAKLTIKRSENAYIRVNVTGVKDNMWTQETQSVDTSSSSLKILKITGPEEGITPDNTTVLVELPSSLAHSIFVFEEVRAELQSVSRLTLTTLRGKITGRMTGEGVKYFMQKGEIQSFQHSGNLEIESFGGKIAINEGRSPLRIQLFSGDLVIEKNTGTLTLESQSSSAKINGQQGMMSLQWGKGSLVMKEFAGRLEGTSNDGQLQLQVKPESMIDLQAQRGRVQVNLPAGSGASLNLRSTAGDLSVPNPLKPGREGRFRVARGKLGGSLKGSVNIRSEDASIVIR